MGEIVLLIVVGSLVVLAVAVLINRANRSSHAALNTLNTDIQALLTRHEQTEQGLGRLESLTSTITAMGNTVEEQHREIESLNSTIVNLENIVVEQHKDIESVASTLTDIGNVVVEQHKEIVSRKNQEDEHFSIMEEKVPAQLAQQITQLEGDLDAKLIGLRQDVEQSVGTVERKLDAFAQPIQQFSNILDGHVQRQGAVGERIVAHLLRQLPADWIRQNVYFGTQVVEFAVQTPVGRLIPIDSKWAATRLLQVLAELPDDGPRTLIVRQIQDAVTQRAREVKKYLDPHRTLGMAVATVPDGVFQHCRPIQAKLAQEGIVLVGYSMLVPYILFMRTFISNTQISSALLATSGIQKSMMLIESLQQTLPLNSLENLSEYVGNLNQSNIQIKEVEQQLQLIEGRLQEVRESLPVPVGTEQLSVLVHQIESLKAGLISVQNQLGLLEAHGEVRHIDNVLVEDTMSLE